MNEYQKLEGEYSLNINKPTPNQGEGNNERRITHEVAKATAAKKAQSA